jgi:hypothetical protein
MGVSESCIAEYFNQESGKQELKLMRVEDKSSKFGIGR